MIRTKVSNAKGGSFAHGVLIISPFNYESRITNHEFSPLLSFTLHTIIDAAHQLGDAPVANGIANGLALPFGV